MYFSASPASSYSSLAMDIPSSSTSRRQSPSSCAFPSWPRRSSLDSNEGREEAPASSYISNDDLEDLFPCVFEEDNSPMTTPSRSLELQEQVVVDTGAMMRQLIAEEKAKKEKRSRRKSAGKKPRSSSGGSSKPMSPIAEVGE